MRAVGRYQWGLVILHWALAALILFDLGIATAVLRHIPNDVPRKLEGLRSHLGGGLLILVLMTLRLGLRLRTDVPPHAPTGNASLDRLAWLSHRAFYVAVFGMIASGATLAMQARLPQVLFMGQGVLPNDFWGYSARYVHLVCARLLMALIALHLAGVLYHSLLLRDGLLRRMWFGPRQVAAPAAESAREDRS